MKKLIISVKPTSSALDEITKRMRIAEKKKGKVSPHFEISFTDMKHFKRFIRNIDILTSIQLLKPKSIYELASMLHKDVGNLNKIINFFEELGALEFVEKKINGRNVKEPIVPYQKIEFDL
ncbi:MAG: hypothetical protein ACOCUH_04490, partial [Bacteriovoracia bacterium]